MRANRHFGFWNSGCILSTKRVSTCNKYFYQPSVSPDSWSVSCVDFSCSPSSLCPLLPSTQQGLPDDTHAVLCPAREGCSPVWTAVGRAVRGQGSPAGHQDPMSLSRSISICLLNRPWLNKLSSPAPPSSNAAENIQTPQPTISSAENRPIWIAAWANGVVTVRVFAPCFTSWTDSSSLGWQRTPL